MSSTHSMTVYPRRRVQRALLRSLGRMLLPLLTKTQVTGIGNFPAHGPLIVVGNHIAAMEVVLMVVHAPWQMELLGPGDIPPPPLMHAIARYHGYIPIERGNLDRIALEQALSVLHQGGIVGIFPEGGIWDPGIKPAKPGVAWLSYRSQAPILPIGFGGLQGALHAALTLQRPHLAMAIGELIPPVQLQPGVPHKVGYQQAAQRVMDEVESLIPPEFRPPTPTILDERFDFSVAIHDPDGRDVPVPSYLSIAHGASLGKLFHRPALLQIFAKDLHLDVAALQAIDQHPPASQIAAALDAILGYLNHTNPYFFTYRFGNTEGQAFGRGLRELHALATWCAQEGYTLTATPIRTYRPGPSAEPITETRPGHAQSW